MRKILHDEQDGHGVQKEARMTFDITKFVAHHMCDSWFLAPRVLLMYVGMTLAPVCRIETVRTLAASTTHCARWHPARKVVMSGSDADLCTCAP